MRIMNLALTKVQISVLEIHANECICVFKHTDSVKVNISVLICLNKLVNCSPAVSDINLNPL